ncbi:MAG: hypothetical protein Q4F56_00690 [Candidatus Saccharibacteria bacterium]|nr:hypothetical protein [Candidatus Saccharibacteria bacterium]
MPENLISYPREEVNKYYEDIIFMVKMVRRLPKDNSELQEFADRTTILTPEPEEFKDFRGALESIQDSGRALGLPQFFSSKMAQLLFRNLYSSAPRRKYYLRFLRSQCRCASGTPELYSVVQLEEKYQYYLYCKDRAERNLSKMPFKKWRITSDCATFYKEVTDR